MPTRRSRALAGTALGSPLQWFSLADELGEREALERACLREALELFCRRPAHTSLSVNLSAPALLDRRTLRMLDHMPDLTGLIIEVTEETLVHDDSQLSAAMEPLRERGALMAVDDIGAGYSGLSQITAVHPSYLKLDRSLVPRDRRTTWAVRRSSARWRAMPSASAGCWSPRAWSANPSCAR